MTGTVPHALVERYRAFIAYTPAAVTEDSR